MALSHTTRRDQWPAGLSEAYSRYPGPYTHENSEVLLDEEAIELFNGWPVWQEMTDAEERRIAGNMNVILDLAARQAGFGQVFPDQFECLLSDGSVLKPDASILSWQRFKQQVKPQGASKKPTMEGGPELVVEIRSPSNRRTEEQRKRTLYFANAVQLIWDVDIKGRQILVYQYAEPKTPRRFTGNDKIDCEPFLPGWRRSVADFFGEQLSAEKVAGEVAVTWRAESRLQALREVLLLQAQARFGLDVPPNLPALLSSQPEAHLMKLAALLATISSLEQWLAAFL